MSELKVYVDQELEELIPLFLDNRRKDIQKLKTLADQDNWAEIKKLGHNIKGAGGGYGFDQITEFGRELEKAAEEADRKEVEELISKLEDYLEKVEIIYK